MLEIDRARIEMAPCLKKSDDQQCNYKIIKKDVVFSLKKTRFDFIMTQKLGITMKL